MKNLKSIVLDVSLAAVATLSLDASAQAVVNARSEDRYVPPSSPLVRERLEWFQDQKLCLMMHFGLYSIWGITESWPLVTKDAFWARDDVEWTRDDAEFKRQYYALNRCFNPVRFNGGAIAKTARRCGFRYVAFTAKHHDGFCLYDTKYTDYKTTSPDCPYSASAKPDMVKDLFDACRAEGLGISLYFSKADWHHDDFWEDKGIGRFTSRYPTYKMEDAPAKWARFCEFTKNQIVELVENYGPIDVLWLDGGWVGVEFGYDLKVSDIVAAARRIQPNLISVDRGQMDENMNIRTPEQTVPATPLGYPWESCITMSGGWSYHYDDFYKDARELLHVLIDIVSKGGNLALNVGVAPDGSLPAPALERMEAMGAWLAKNGKAIYSTRAAETYAIKKWRFTRGKDGRDYAIRLWGRDEGPRLVHVLLNVSGEQGEVRRVVHLASGREMEFRPTTGERDAGVLISFPDGFARDEYAEAFEVEYRIPETERKEQQ